MHENNRQLIDLLYREILGRGADEGGVKNYGRLLAKENRDEGVAAAVRGLLASMEFMRRPDTLSRLARHTLCRNAPRQLNGNKIQHIASLGTHCLTSFLMKTYGLKAYSLPFDWLFSSPAAVLHCIDDNFETFLDRSYYASVTEKRQSKEPGADHTFYVKNFDVGDMFAHRDPLDPGDHTYFRRAAARFNALLRTKDAKLFVMISRSKHDLVDTYQELSDRIRSLTENSALLCVQLLDPTLEFGARSMRMLKRQDEHALYEFQPSSREVGIGFEDPLDDIAIMQLIWQYDIELAPAIENSR